MELSGPIVNFINKELVPCFDVSNEHTTALFQTVCEFLSIQVTEAL
jgi:hypothetical protein